MKAEDLAEWIKSAAVDEYHNGTKQVIIASKYNDQLILYCHRVEYPHGLHPHVNLVWISDGKVELLRQDIVDVTYGTITHGTGDLTGEFGPSENLETVWCALVKKLRGEI